MVAFSTWEAKKNELIRKATGGSMFMAATSAIKLTALTGTSDSSLIALPTGWSDVGLMSDEGMQWARSVELSEVTSFGQSTPTRSDVTTDEETVAVTLQELNKNTIMLFTGAASASLTPDATTGELKIAKPTAPQQRSYQILGLAKDNNASGDIYIAKYFPNAVVTDFSEQSFAKSDDPITYGVTLRAQLDSTLGYAVAYFFAGPGFKALATASGLGA